jgi:aminopeptidase N
MRLTPILAAVMMTLPVHAGTLTACYCDKHLMPRPMNLVPGRKYARDRLADIQHLRLEVTPDFGKRTIAGSATLSFKPIAKPLSQLALDAVGLLIGQITAEGAQIAEHEVTQDKLVITFTPSVAVDALAAVTIRYRVQPEQGLYFRTPEMGYKPGDTQLWTQGEAELHRFWFPSYDYPNERFTSEVICHVPDFMQVISNGKLLSQTKGADGLTAWHWRQDRPHVNYLVALAAGFFHKLEDKAGDLPLALYVPPSEAKQAEAAFRDTKGIMEFYQQEIGVPFPWDKYDQVYCHDFLAGGMENTSCTFNAAGLLFTDETEQLDTLHRLDAHETAHQWFGDLVTCRDWSHLWLNEGFASYYTILYEERKNGTDAMKYSLWREAEKVIEANDGKPTVWRDYEDPMQQFDYRVYPKGAWILHMLRSQLGPELYRRCIKTYLERHRDQVVGTDDLHDVFEELSGMSFDAFFDQWLHHGGLPELNITYSWDGAGRQAKLTVKQTQKLSERVLLFHVPLPVRFTMKDGSTRDFTARLSKAEEDFHFPLGAQPDMIRIDPDYTVLAKTEFTPPPDMLKRQLHGDLIGRMLAARILGNRKDADSVKQLDALLNGDAFHAVRSEAAKSLKKMASPEARAVLARSLKQADARARLDVVEALAAFPHPEAQQALEQQAATEKNPEILAAIIKTWGARPGDAQISTALRKQLQTRAYWNPVAISAIKAMRAQDDATAVSFIMPRLRETPLDFRTREFAGALDDLAFLARGQRDKGEVRGFIAGYLNSPREELRAGAAKALGTLRDPAAIAMLQPLIEVRKPFADPVRSEAEKAVQNLQSLLDGPQDLKKVWDEMQRLQRKTEELEKEIGRLRKTPVKEEVKPAVKAG